MKKIALLGAVAASAMMMFAGAASAHDFTSTNPPCDSDWFVFPTGGCGPSGHHYIGLMGSGSHTHAGAKGGTIYGTVGNATDYIKSGAVYVGPHIHAGLVGTVIPTQAPAAAAPAAPAAPKADAPKADHKADHKADAPKAPAAPKKAAATHHKAAPKAPKAPKAAN